MASFGDRFYNEDVGHADMVEAPRRQPESKAKNIVIGVGLGIALAAGSIILVRGSLPELTPEQIVQLDDYQGQQPPRHIFNLYSLKQEKERKQAEMAIAAPAQVTDDEAKVVAQQQRTTTPVAPVQGQSANSGPAVERVEVIDRNPATQMALNPTVSTVYEKAELQREAVLPVVASVNASEIVASSKPAGNQSKMVSENASELMVLPVYAVGKNRVNLRSSPAFESDVLDILEIGQTVTVFDSIGDWAQVATNDGSGTTGFIHSTMLEAKDLRP